MFGKDLPVSAQPDVHTLLGWLGICLCKAAPSQLAENWKSFRRIGRVRQEVSVSYQGQDTVFQDRRMEAPRRVCIKLEQTTFSFIRT